MYPWGGGYESGRGRASGARPGRGGGVPFSRLLSDGSWLAANEEAEGDVGL